MFTKTIYIEKDKYAILLNSIRDFADKKNYKLTEQVEELKHIFAIYNSYFESIAVINALEMMVGSSLIPERIRIMGIISWTHNNLEVMVKGEILMNLFNYVNDKPRKMDALRCEDLFNKFIKKISNLKLD